MRIIRAQTSDAGPSRRGVSLARANQTIGAHDPCLGKDSDPDYQSRPSPAIRSVLAIGLVLVAFCAFFLTAAARANAEMICADDVVPFGTAVTATGTAPSCDGSCRAREIKPVCGLVMKICAGQPIPKGYTLDSVTSMPGCQCLGYDDDAYVIRYTGPDGPAALLSSSNNQLFESSSNSKRIPFGNPLCLPNATQTWFGGGGAGGVTPWSQGYAGGPFQNGQANGQYMQPAPGMMTMPNMSGMSSMGPPASYGQSGSNQSEQEPFRIGQ